MWYKTRDMWGRWPLSQNFSSPSSEDFEEKDDLDEYLAMKVFIAPATQSILKIKFSFLIHFILSRSIYNISWACLIWQFESAQLCYYRNGSSLGIQPFLFSSAITPEWKVDQSKVVSFLILGFLILPPYSPRTEACTITLPKQSYNNLCTEMTELLKIEFALFVLPTSLLDWLQLSPTNFIVWFGMFAGITETSIKLAESFDKFLLQPC